MLANDYATSAANATVGAGALGFAGGGSLTDATTSPTVEAYLGANVKRRARRRRSATT